MSQRPRSHVRRSVTLGIAAGVVILLGFSVAMAAVAGVATLDKERYRLNETPQLQVADADLNTNPATKQTATVRLSSSTDPTGILVTLRESDVNTGIFNDEVTAVSFTDTGGSDDPTNVLRVDPGNTVTLSYTDASPAGTRTDTATMFIDNATADLDADAYTVSDTPTLTVNDVDGNLNASAPDTVAVNFKSDSDATGISVDLTETGNATGLFTGTATFTTGASDDGADELEVAAGDTVTLTHGEPDFAGTGTIGRTDTALIQTAGVATLNATRYRANQTATLTVDDADLNTDDLAIETVDVNLASTDDATGITVTLTETLPTSGIFTGSASFSTIASDDGADELLIDEASIVTLTYEDAAPAADRTDTATLYSDGATAALNAERYRLNQTATLTVTDVDRNADAGTAESFSVNLTSTSDGTGVNVTLTETGGDTGIFTGTATFNTVVSNDVSDSLLVAAGGTVTLTYDEPNFAGDADIERTGTAAMYANTATVTLDQGTYALDETATITVDDADANLDSDAAETLAVTLTSSTDGSGISITLTETGDATGTFTGTATFSDTGSSDPSDVLHVASGDTVTATYLEPNFAGDDTIARTDTADMNVDGTVALDTTIYAVDETATLTVTDADLNISSVSAQTVPVTFVSDTDPAGINLVLTETGADTGVFTDTASFSTGPSDDPTDVLQVAEGDTVTVTYAETTTFSGTPADRTDSATLYADGATATLDRERYRLNQTPTLSVTDADRSQDPLAAESFAVTLTSTSDGGGISVDLTETGNDTGVFSDAGVTFSTVATNDVLDQLLVAAGDTLTLTYAEPDFSGGTTSRTDTATMFADTATATLDAAIYALDDTATLTVSDVDANLDSAAAETVSATLTSASDGAGIGITLTETGDATGVFTGTATFSDTASDDPTDVLLVAGGDALTLTYAEPNFAGDDSIARTDTAAMQTDGTIGLDGQRYALADTATITVADDDLNSDAGSAQSVDVSFASGTDPAGITVSLDETGNDTGIFTGTATFSTTASDDGADVLLIAAGASLTATYSETTTFDGPDEDRTAAGQMFADTGTISLDAGAYSLDETATLTVMDADANDDPADAETLDVTFTSSSDATGITVTLTETGVDTGIFTGAATFSDIASDDGGDVLLIAGGDLLTARYVEALFAGGTANRSDLADVRIDGSAFLNADTYALSDTVTMTVTDLDLNTSAADAETVEVELASTTDPATIHVTLIETGDNTATFTGTATFSDTATDDDADVLHVASGDTVTLTYPETTTFAGPDADQTDTAQLQTDGSVSLDRERYRLNQTAGLSVTDPDLNTDPGSPQSVDIGFASDSDATGITVTLTESGNDTGIFAGTASFSDTISDDPTDVLLVAAGDTVTATYTDDDTFAGAGSEDRTRTATMFADGATAALDQEHYALDDTATMTVTDIDGNLDSTALDTVSVSLASGSDVGGISVDLTETGNATGVFSGTATFSDTASDDPTDVLLIAEGDTIGLAYNEPDFAGTGTVGRSDEATAFTDGSAAFDAPAYALDDTATLTVTDPDLNTDAGVAETVDVDVASDSDPGTISVTLTETDLDSGVFTGTNTFSDTATDDDADELFVAGGDALTVTYAETTTFAGPDADRTGDAVTFTDGTLALDAIVYDLDDTATITVTDADLDTDAGSAQSVDVALVSTTDATGITVTLDETGNDTGVFTGTATFSTGPSDDGADVLQVSASDTVTATYAETTTFAGPDEDRTDSATMFGDGATVAFDQDSYGVGSTATITVTDADVNDDAGTAQSVVVGLASDSDGTGISVTLDETGNDTGVFTGTATFSDTASDDPTDVLLIAAGDELTVTYDEPDFDGGGTTERTDTATVGTNGSASLDAGRYAISDTATLSVTDVDLNADAGTPDTVDVELASDSDPSTITVTLTETGDDTDTFEGTATFNETATDDGADSLLVAPGDDVTLTYAETTTYDGPDADRTDTAGIDPAVTGTDPAAGGRGIDDVDVAVLGEGFNAGAVATFSSPDITVNSTTWVSDTEVTANIDIDPGATLGDSDVTVTNTNGGTGTCVGCFTITEGPTVTDVSPAALARGVQDVTIVISGTDFQDGAEASFAGAGITVDSTTFVSSARVDAVIDIAPGAALGADDVTVTNPDSGSGTCVGCFTVRAAPAAMDFNGDGFTDLAVGAPGETFSGKRNAGGVNVIYGGAGSLAAAGDQFWYQNAQGILDAVEAGDRFGAAVASGDFDGDGFADLAIGVPGESVGGDANAGAVNVIYGRAGGLHKAGDQFWTQDSPGIGSSARPGERFGEALAVGDFDGDGFADLAIGVPGEKLGGGDDAGLVTVIYGGPDGLTAVGDQFWHQNVAGIANAAAANDRFGSSLAAIDIDGDGNDDLIVGVPGERIGGKANAGAANVIFGSSDGLDRPGDEFWHQNRSGIPSAARKGDRFGSAVTGGDFDGDGFGDAAFGVPGERIGGHNRAGAVNVIFGAGGGLTSTGASFLTQNSGGVPGVAGAGDRFGSSLASGDDDSDGRADLAVGVPFDDVGSRSEAGSVHLFPGTPGGPSTGADQWLHQDVAGVASGSRTGDRFGFALTFGDFDGSGDDDLVIGAPGERLGGNNGAGAVNVLYSDGNAIGVSGGQFWHQNRTGIGSAARSGDGFGSAL